MYKSDHRNDHLLRIGCRYFVYGARKVIVVLNLELGHSDAVRSNAACCTRASMCFIGSGFCVCVCSTTVLKTFADVRAQRTF